MYCRNFVDNVTPEPDYPKNSCNLVGKSLIQCQDADWRGHDALAALINTVVDYRFS